jgi:glycosyl transferase family 1/glycosyl transferase family 4
LRLLVLATKAPWPPLDGGRLLLAHTLQALAAAGCRPTLVAPVDPARFDLDRIAAALAPWCAPRLVAAAPVRPPLALLRGLRGRAPLSVARHSLPAVRREVERLLAGERFDLVHAEQLQALAQAAPAARHGLPVVLRAQNVESDLWRGTARQGGRRAWALAFEAARLARWEGEAVRRSAMTLALTAEDAGRLRALAGDPLAGGRVRVVSAPFPELPAATARLAGEPAVVVLGSRGWLPNEDSAAWFLGAVWPEMRRALPGAVLHLFGAGPTAPLPAGAVLHPAPADSGEAFAAGSILAVPLHIASGVRMKVLEAWARGVPVVATPAALAGLEVEDGREALVAADAAGFAAACSRLHREPGLAAALVAAGRRARRERHDPAKIAAELLAAYAAVTASSPT